MTISRGEICLFFWDKQGGSSNSAWEVVRVTDDELFKYVKLCVEQGEVLVMNWREVSYGRHNGEAYSIAETSSVLSKYPNNKVFVVGGYDNGISTLTLMERS